MSEYSGYKISELFDLPLGAFLLIKRESWIYSMMQHEESRAILKRIYELQQTKIDDNAVQRFQHLERS